MTDLETRQEAWENVAGLLTRMGYAARVDPAYVPSGQGLRAGSIGPVLAIVTCAPPIVIGMCLGLTAEEPEAHVPTEHLKVPKAKAWEPGDPQFAYWA